MPAPAVLLSAFASDGLELTVAFLIPDPEGGQLNVRCEVDRAVLRWLNQNGVEIPYLQRVLRRAGR